MRRITLATTAAAALLALGSAPPSAFAQTSTSLNTDAQIFIGPPGSSSSPGGTAQGGEANLLTGTSAGTSFVAGVDGNHPMQAPLLLFFALPSAATVSVGFAGPPAPGCPSTGCPPAPTGFYGFNGTASVSGSTNIYTQLGLTDTGGGVHSVTVPNFDAIATAQTNISPPLPAPTSYIIDAFAIPSGLVPGQGISLDETGAPAGTFIFAYDCIVPDPTHMGCSDGDVGATPLTNVGLITTSSGSGPPPPPPPPPPPVPEPSSLAIFAVALLGLLWRVRSRKPTDPAA